jgi:hypothetical protein
MTMKPQNYGLVNLSTDIFDCGQATPGNIYPIQNDMLLNLSCSLPFFNRI